MTGVAHQQDLEKMALTQDYRFALSERQGQYDLERQRIRNIGRQQELEDRFDYERELYDYQLTSEQKDRESKIRQALSVIEHDETLTPEDRAESRRLLAYELAGITPIPKRKEPTPGIDDLVQFHEGSGAYFLTDPSTGKRTEVKGPAGDTMTKADAWKIAIPANTLDGVLDMDAARKMVEEMTTGGVLPGRGVQTGYGLRPDGTQKGGGFFGPLQGRGPMQGYDMSEYSIGVDFDGKEMDIPTMVPTLTENELNSVLRGEVTPAIKDKAISHAKMRLRLGKSVFAEEGEQMRPDRQIQMMEDRLNEIQGTPPEVRQDIKTYGGITNLKEPKEIGSITEAQAHILSLQSDLADHRRKVMKKMPKGISNAELGSSMQNMAYTPEEQIIMNKIIDYKRREEELRKARNQGLIYLHMAETNKTIAGQ
jgi:hypothetical protein